ncbi:MAG: hypothetical protein ACRCXL_10305 [Dermatophilaceae bacterium]
MTGIDPEKLDQAVSEAFEGLTKAVSGYSEKSVYLYGHALEALVRLREQEMTITKSRAAGLDRTITPADA